MGGGYIDSLDNLDRLEFLDCLDGIDCPDWRSGRGLVVAAEGTLYFALVVRFAERLALVVSVLALAEGYLHLGKTFVVDEKTERDDGLARVGREFGEFAEFFALQEEFAVALRLMVGVTAETVLCNVHLLDPQLITLELAIGIRKARPALADGLDLRAVEDNARGVAVENEIVERGTLVLDIYITFQSHGSVG